MALTPLVCPAQVWIQRFGKKQLSLSFFLSLGASIQERPMASFSALPWNRVLSVGASSASACSFSLATCKKWRGLYQRKDGCVH